MSVSFYLWLRLLRILLLDISVGCVSDFFQDVSLFFVFFFFSFNHNFWPRRYGFLTFPC